MVEPTGYRCSTLEYSPPRPRPVSMTVAKTVSFCAAHRLPEHKGKCQGWHGHDWTVEVVVRGTPDPVTGMVIDFSDMKTVMNEKIMVPFDHKVLNDVLDNPTAENLALYIWEELEDDLPGLEVVKVWEAPGSYVSLFKRNVAIARGEHVTSK